MAIHIPGGGGIHLGITPPPISSDVLRTRVVYRLPTSTTFVKIDSYVQSWVTLEDISRPVSTAKINVVPSFLTDRLDDTIVDGSEIRIYIGNPAPSTLWFAGYKSSLQKDGVSAVINVKSKGVEMERRIVTQDFVYQKSPVYSGRLVEIAKYIIDNFTSLDSQGIVFDSTKILNKLVFDHSPVIEALSLIEETLNWELYERRGVIYLQPEGTLDNNVTLTVGETGTNGCKKLGNWETDQSKMVNSFTVFSSDETFDKIEYFSGTGGANQENTLTYPFFGSVTVEISPDGGTTWVTKDGGIDGSTVDYDYTVHTELSTKSIKWDGTSNYQPPAGSDNIRVSYTYTLQTSYLCEDATSIASYGKFEDSIVRSDLTTLTDVTEYATSYVAAYKDPFLKGKLLCRRHDLSTGEKVTIVDTRNGINQKFTISYMELQWPQNQLVLEVGEQPKRTGDWRKGVAERVRRLEERNRGYSVS